LKGGVDLKADEFGDAARKYGNPSASAAKAVLAVEMTGVLGARVGGR